VRVARYLSDVSAQPRLALERDGCLFDVEALEREFSMIVRTEAASDFRTRVAILRGAGLHEIDAKLLRGQRPESAVRSGPRTLLLPPCDTERAHFIRVAHTPQGLTTWLGDARGLLGPGAFVSLPDGAARARTAPCLGVMVSDELSRATEADAARSIVGFSLVNDWSWVDAAGAAFDPAAPRSVSAQLGPALLSTYEAGPLDKLEVRVLVGEEVKVSALLGAMPVSPAEAVAFASRYYQLRPGDVVALTAIGGDPAVEALAHQAVHVSLDRFGELRGVAVPAR
jgi:2-keto-4-pentenoate hydratase/2-oxohepta-3-ene-1,7-dioic acid hydratase in catechol pathway